MNINTPVRKHQQGETERQDCRQQRRRVMNQTAVKQAAVAGIAGDDPVNQEDDSKTEEIRKRNISHVVHNEFLSTTLL